MDQVGSGNRSAIHLRTGTKSIADAVGAWLERHGIQVLSFADAFEACTFMIKCRQASPTFAFVGTDWLAPDEFSVIRYLRETWPGMVIVLYTGREARVCAPDSLTHVLRSGDGLRRFLRESPEYLLRGRPRRGPRHDAAAGPIATARLPTVQQQRDPDAETAGHPPGVSSPAPHERLDDARAPVSEPGSRAAAPQGPAPTTPSLTREELAALLADKDD